MADFDIRADSIDTHELLGRVRARIAEKRGVDYTEQEIRELAAVKLERFLDPRAVRSDLLQQFRISRRRLPSAPDPESLFAARRPIVARLRRLLRPLLRLFINPDPLPQALACLNQVATEVTMTGDLYYELLHNLVVELTRTTMEVKNLKMRVESLTGRVELDERRARALEGVVVYRPRTADRHSSDQLELLDREGPGQRSARLRRRRSRRGRPPATTIMGAGTTEISPSTSAEQQSRPPTETKTAPKDE